MKNDHASDHNYNIVQDLAMMQIALAEAKIAAQQQEVPIGAVLTLNHQIIAKSHNCTIQQHDPSAHAEILVLRQAGRHLKTHYLNDCELYVTLEPCSMCSSAISIAHIKRLIFGAISPKTGAILHNEFFFQQPNCFYKPQLTYGILQDECSSLLKNFFINLRIDSNNQ